VKALNFHPRFSFEGLVVWLRSDVSGVKALSFVFVAGFLVRLVPELLAFSAPIGFDTVYYAAVMKSGVVWANWSSFFTSTWLLHALTVPLYSVFQVDPFLLLKALAPALYGLNVAGVYWLGRKQLGWDVKLCLAAAGLFAVQLAALRISWDLLRNTLGMGLLLFALPFIGKISSKRDFALFALLSLLTVFAHEYAGVALVTVVFGVVVWRFVRKRFGRADGLTVLAVLPALAVFLTGLFLRFFPVNYGATNVLSTGEASVGRFMFFANYLATNDGVFYYSGYADLMVDVVLLFSFLYLSYLFLVWKGFFRNGVLNVWTGLLLVGSFGCLVWPFFALDYWSRWMFMLVYPFTFYAVNGFSKLFHRCSHGKGKISETSKKIISGGLGITVLMSSVYLATPLLMNNNQVGVFALPNVSAHFSSAPAVPYQDVHDVVEAMTWLDGNMVTNSCSIVNLVFIDWAQLYINKSSHITIHFWNDAGLALNDALNHGFDSVYFVWWNQDVGWYNVSVPKQFVSLKDFGRISVYEYTNAVDV
jgi:hypothetical protein